MKTRWLLLPLLALSAETGAGPMKPPGACVDPVADFKRRLAQGGTPFVKPDIPDFDGVSKLDIPDLDSDGRKDLMLAESFSCGSGGCPWFLYVRRGTCAHYVGDAGGQEPELIGKRTGGWRRFRIESHAGACPYHEYEHHFKNGEYRTVKTRECECDYAADGHPEFVVPLRNRRVVCTRWQTEE